MAELDNGPGAAAVDPQQQGVIAAEPAAAGSVGSYVATPPNRKWSRKRFIDGQVLSQGRADGSTREDALNARFRQSLGMAIPFLIVHLVWWSQMIKHDSFSMMVAEVGDERVPAYLMSITMVFGSMLAGATSEGGAAVAFPVMTLVFGIAPSVARDFSFMIQSVGMTGAAFTILFMRLQVEWKSILYCSVGGVAGIIVGLEQIAPLLTPPYAKMYFSAIWASFAACLYFLNRLHGRRVYLVLDPPDCPRIWQSGALVPQDWHLADAVLNWKALSLAAMGLVGGIFTSIAGSGIDICSFAMLTLLFRVSEKTATPTSVVLMAIGTVIAMLYRQFWMEGLHADAWKFFVVCAPIVVVGAPLGALVGSYLNRLVIAAVLYTSIGLQLFGALFVIRPWTDEKCNETTDCTPSHLMGTSVAIFIAGLLIFYAMQRFGHFLAERREEMQGHHVDQRRGDNTFLVQV